MDGGIKKLLRDIKDLGLGGSINREMLDRIEDALRDKDFSKQGLIGLPENACPECGWLDGKHTKKCKENKE